MTRPSDFTSPNRRTRAGAGLLFYAASAAHNLGETLALFIRYARLVNESLRLALASHPEGVALEFDFVGVSRQRVRQNTEFWIGTMIKASRQITGRHIRPIRVACPHVRNSDLREFERFYGCPVEFNAPTGQLVFSNKTLALPLLTRDPRLLETLRPFCEAAARARNTPVGSLRAAVEDEVQRQLPHGRVSAPTVAKVLALSVRSLSRRLSEEGTTFVEVVDQMRHSLALQYLKEPGFASAQIAWLLGYEGQTSFNHAFRRWTGHSPLAARRRRSSRSQCRPSRAWFIELLGRDRRDRLPGAADAGDDEQDTEGPFRAASVSVRVSTSSRPAKRSARS